MKKILILALVLLAVAAALPIIGNTVVKQTIDTKILELKQYGIETKVDKESSTYLNTSRHFEFVIEDSEEFVAYINKYSNQQMPPYVDAMLDGVVIGADVEYANFPLSKATSVELYPLGLSDEMSDNLKKEDMKFYEYLDTFLKSKGILYHINYDIASSSFDGFIKNINESYTLKDGTKLNAHLKDALFDGKGALIAPDSLSSVVKVLRLDVDKAKEKIIFTLNDFSSSSSFESQTTYITSAELKSFTMLISGTNDDMNVKMKNIRVNASSNTQGKNAEVNSKSSLESLVIASKRVNFDLKNLNFDIAANGIDKEAFEELRVLAANSDIATSAILQKELELSLLKLFSKGFVINIADFSLENITLDAKENLKGFNVKSEITIKEDANLAQKVKMSPLMAISNLNVTTDISISDEMYAKLTQGNPMTSQMAQYAKKENGNVIFKVEFIDGGLSVNGQALR